MKRKKPQRTETIPVRLTPEERVALEHIARKSRDYPATFCRKIVLGHIEATTSRTDR